MKKNSQEKMDNQRFSKVCSKFLLILFIFLLPTQLGRHFFLSFSYLSGVRVDYLAPTIYLTDIIACLLIAINRKTIIKFLNNRNLIFIIFLFSVNIVLAKSPPLALYRLFKILEFLSVFIIFKNLPIVLNEIVLAFFLGGVGQLFLASLQFVDKHSLQGIFYFLGERAINLSTPGVAKASLLGIEILRPYATFSHPNSMAGFYLLLYFFILTDKNISNSAVKSGLLLVSSLLVFLSFSKLAIGTFLCLNIIYWWKNYSRKICRFCVLSSLCIFTVISFVFLAAKTDPLTINKRIELMENSFRIIITYPVFGVGLNNYLIAQNRFSTRYPYFFPQPVHNIFLLFIGEAGIIISALVFYYGLKYIKKCCPEEPLIFFLLIVVITGFFDHYWLTLQQNLLIAGVIGGIVCRKRS